jgi:hypothetical protein
MGHKESAGQKEAARTPFIVWMISIRTSCSLDARAHSRFFLTQSRPFQNCSYAFDVEESTIYSAPSSGFELPRAAVEACSRELLHGHTHSIGGSRVSITASVSWIRT